MKSNVLPFPLSNYRTSMLTRRRLELNCLACHFKFDEYPLFNHDGWGYYHKKNGLGYFVKNTKVIDKFDILHCKDVWGVKISLKYYFGRFF